MSNYRFIQVDPPKEQLTLPSSIVDFAISSTAITEELVTFTFTSTVATFTGVSSKDLLQMSFVDPDTFIETFMCIVEVASVASVNEITTSVLNTSIPAERKIVTEISDFRGKEFQILYKLPTNNISVQVKTDSIVRYYEDPVDKTIMYLDLIESGSVCSITGNTNIVTYGEFQDYGGSTLALTTSYTDWTSGAAGLNSNITMTTSPNKFTIITPGTYKLEGSFSISSSAANTDITLSISKNGAVLPETENERHFQSAGAGGSISIVDLIEVAVGDEITLSVKASTATTMTINNISLNIKLLEGTGGTPSCTDIWEHDRASLGIVTLNNTNKLPYRNIVPYLNSIFIDS